MTEQSDQKWLNRVCPKMAEVQIATERIWGIEFSIMEDDSDGAITIGQIRTIVACLLKQDVENDKSHKALLSMGSLLISHPHLCSDEFRAIVNIHVDRIEGEVVEEEPDKISIDTSKPFVVPDNINKECYLWNIHFAELVSARKLLESLKTIKCGGSVYPIEEDE